jgi:hypothetical protein
VWPSDEDCPGFENAFKDLSRFMIDVGKKVARACDDLGQWGDVSFDERRCLLNSATTVAGHITTQKTFEELFSSSSCAKARLLHYFPAPAQTLKAGQSEEAGVDEQNDWCGWHLDHSLLTALCPAMFLFTPSDRGEGVEPLSIPSPSPTSGLYIKTRSGKQVKAVIPPDCLAFQTGEALECMSQGRLRATPHAVRAGSGIGTEVKELLRQKGFLDGTVSRETMAVFMQPDIDEVR